MDCACQDVRGWDGTRSIFDELFWRIDRKSKRPTVLLGVNYFGALPLSFLVLSLRYAVLRLLSYRYTTVSNNGNTGT